MLASSSIGRKKSSTSQKPVLAGHQALHEFLKSEIYRGRMFALNDVRTRRNGLSFGPECDDDVYREVDRQNAPLLEDARRSLETHSERVDVFLDALERAT